MRRTYNPHLEVPTIAPVQRQRRLPEITSSTKLVNAVDASRMISEEKGLKLSPKRVRELCRMGQWQQGYHWVRPSRAYLINLEAVYETIATGRW